MHGERGCTSRSEMKFRVVRVDRGFRFWGQPCVERNRREVQAVSDTRKRWLADPPSLHLDSDFRAPIIKTRVVVLTATRTQYLHQAIPSQAQFRD